MVNRGRFFLMWIVNRLRVRFIMGRVRFMRGRVGFLMEIGEMRRSWI